MTDAQRRNAVRFVVLTVFIDAVGFGIVMPVLPQVVMALGHVGLAEATRIGGWLGLVYAAVQFLSGPLMGNLGDRFGRRPVLLGALGGFAIDYALLGFAPSLGWLFAGRALAGLFGASYGPAGAAMADLSAPDQRARHFGMIGGAFGVGFVVGPAIGGLLGEMGPRAPFHAAAILAGLNFLLGLAAFPETLAAADRRAFSLLRSNPLGALLSLRRVPGLMPIAFATFWWSFAGMVYPATWPFYTIAAFGWSPGMIGASLALVGLMMAFNQVVLVGRAVRTFGERGAAQFGMAASLLAFLAYAATRQGWLVFPILMLGSLQAMVMPSLNGMMSRRVPADGQGELQGFTGSIMAIGSILAPIVYNPVLAHFAGGGAAIRFPGVVFLIAAAATAVAILTLAFIARAPAGDPPAKSL